MEVKMIQDNHTTTQTAAEEAPPAAWGEVWKEGHITRCTDLFKYLEEQ